MTTSRTAFQPWATPIVPYQQYFCLFPSLFFSHPSPLPPALHPPPPTHPAHALTPASPLAILSILLISCDNTTGLFTMRLQLKSLRFEGAPLVGLGALLAGHSSSSSSPISFATGAVNMPPRSAVSATVAVAAPSFQATSSAVSGTVASPPTSPGRRQKGGGTESLHPSGQEGRGEEEDDETVRPREHVFSRSSRVSSSSEKDPSRDVAGGGGAVVRARRAGLDELAGLELRLGRGTPTLRWSCLEVLR